MAVLRQLNLLSQMRVDVPHLRGMESSIAADFDVVVGRATAGGRAVVVRGFAVSSSTNPNALAMSVADGIVYNVNATEPGSFLWVSSTRAAETLNPSTNSKVVGSWTPGTVNYVGLDLVRSADSTTSDTVQFKNVATDADDPRIIPLGRTLDYTIIITPIPFSAQTNIVPVAKVTLNSSGVVSSLVDARAMLFRLGSGGDSPSNTALYGWPGGRAESGTFAGGDKAFQSQKDWMDAVMTRIWEIGGGERWFSGTADRNVHMVPLVDVLVGGDYYGWEKPLVGDPGEFTWGTDGVASFRILFDNSTAYYNDVLGGIAPEFADGDCIYVDVDRSTTATLTAVQAPLATLGVGPRPGSRIVLAWRSDSSTKSYVHTRDWRYPVGTTFTPATNVVLGVVRLERATTSVSPFDPVNPYVIGQRGGTITSPDLLNPGLTITATPGATSSYSIGLLHVVPTTPTTNSGGVSGIIASGGDAFDDGAFDDGSGGAAAQLTGGDGAADGEGGGGLVVTGGDAPGGGAGGIAILATGGHSTSGDDAPGGSFHSRNIQSVSMASTGANAFVGTGITPSTLTGGLAITNSLTAASSLTVNQSGATNAHEAVTITNAGTHAALKVLQTNTGTGGDEHGITSTISGGAAAAGLFASTSHSTSLAYEGLFGFSSTDTVSLVTINDEANNHSIAAGVAGAGAYAQFLKSHGTGDAGYFETAGATVRIAETAGTENGISVETTTTSAAALSLISTGTPSYVAQFASGIALQTKSVSTVPATYMVDTGTGDSFIFYRDSATNGTGTALYVTNTATSTSNVGIKIEVNSGADALLVTNGHVTIPEDHNFRYATPQTRYLHVLASEFALAPAPRTVSGGASPQTSGPYYYDSGANDPAGGPAYTLDNGQIRCGNSVDGWATAKLRLPAGAAVTGLELRYINLVPGATMDAKATIIRYAAYSASSHAFSYVDWCGNTDATATTGTAGTFETSTTASPISFSALTDDGSQFMIVRVEIPYHGISPYGIMGAIVTYTLTDVHPGIT